MNFIKTLLALLLSFSIWGPLFAGGGSTPSATSLSCNTPASFSLGSNGYTGVNATSAAGSCGQCCFQNSDLDGDGDQDVSFSIENSQWYQYCNTGTTTVTMSFTVDETNNNCNLQGAVFVGAGMGGGTLDCSNTEFQEYGSNVGGAADGFTFSGVNIPAGQCAYIMIDGYGGAACSAATITANCPCTVPVMTSATTATICSGGTVSIPLTTTPTGSTYTWIAASNANVGGESTTTQTTSTLSNTLTNTSGSVQTVTYTVTPTLAGCVGVPQTVTVTVNPAPVVTTANTASVCSGTALNIALTSNPSGATYSWTAASNTQVTGEGSGTGSTINNTLTATTVQVVNYTVTPTLAGCVGAPYVIAVTVSPLPTMSSANSATICGGQAVNLALTSNPSGATFSWIATTNANVGGESTTSQTGSSISDILTNTTSSVQTVSYSVTPTLNGCPGTSQTVTITVNPAPVMTNANAATICSGGTVSIPLTASPTGSTFSWIATANANVTGESTTAQTATTLSNTLTNTSTSVQTVTYTVTPTFSGCPGTAQTITVTVNPIPPVPTITTTAATCTAAGTATISNYVGTQTYTFSPAGPSAGAGGAITGMTAGTSYTVTAGNGSCTSVASASFSIAAQLITPPVPTITTTAATCTAAGTASISNYVGTQTYTFSPAGPTAGAAGAISGMTAGTSYTVTAGNGSCTSAASASFSIAAQLITPPVPTITTTAATCAAAGTASISNYVGTQTYTFSPAGPTAGAAGAISGMTAGTSYTVTAGNGSCTSAASASFSIVAQLITPPVPTITTTAATCTAAGTASISNYVGTQTYTFSPAGPSAGAGGAISAMTAGTSYTVTAGNGSCSSVASASFSIAAQFITPPVPTISTTAATCAAAGTAAISNYVGTQTYTFSPAGPTAGAAGAISGMTAGTSYTVTAGNGSCTSVSSSSFSIDAQLITPPVPTITTTAATCTAAGTATISNYVGTQTYTFSPAGPSAGAGGAISGMTAGTSYTVTAGNGSCTSVASASFSIAAQLITPSVPTISTTAATCAAAGTAAISNYVGTQTYTFSPAGPSAGAGGAITGMTAGTSYTVPAGNGSCTSVASASFSIAAQLISPPVPTISTTAATCTAAGTATISNYVGTQTYTFSPAGPSAGAGGAITGMTAGTSYTVTAGNGSCTSVASTSFSIASQSAVPNAPMITTTLPTCSADGTATITNYVGTQTYIFTPIGPSAGSGGVIAGMTIGTSYTVIASDGVCSSTSSASFSIAAQLTTPVVPTISTTAATCAASGTASVSNYAGTQTYTFTPTGPTSGAGGAITGMTFGTSYTVTTSNGSCTSVASVSFSIAAQLITPPVPTITTSAATCAAAGTASISNYAGTQTYTFSPAGPTAGAAGAISSMTAGTSYTVTAANASCTSVASAPFIIAAQLMTPPVPTITTTTATCTAAGTASISNYVGTQTYSFSPAGPTAGTAGAISGMTAGTSYTVTTGNGSCTSVATAPFIITAQFSPATASLTNNSGSTILTCTLTPINITASGGVSYSWDNSLGTNANVSLTNTGTYTVTVTDINGCTDTESITITQNTTPPTAGITNNTGTTVLTCTLTSISVTATGGVSYAWNNGLGAGAGATITSAGTYILTATAANGCTDTEVITVTSDPTIPTAGITNNTGSTILTCTLTSISVTATGGVSYVWDNGLGSAAGATITAPGTYTVTTTAANGCTDTELITVTQDITPPTAGITNNTGTTVLTCTLTSISVTATGGSTYSWDNGFGSAAGATFTATGTYTVTVTGANGCTDTEAITITDNIINPTAGITNNTGSTVLTCTLTSISVTATGGVSYVWNNGLGSTAGATISAPGTYTVTATAANGCTDTELITITQDITPPTAGIINNTGTTVLTCTLTSISVTATGGGTYLWSNGLGTNANATITSAGTYTVTVTGTNGCADTETITITADPTIPTAGITNNTGSTVLNCALTSISVTATGGVSYAWDNGLGAAAGATITAPGMYTVTATAANGCTDTEIIMITENLSTQSAGITNNTGSTVLTCTLTSISVTATGGGTYSWDNGLGSSAASTITAPGTYTVTVTGSNGCTDTETINVTQDIATPTAGITNNTGTTVLTCTLTSINVTATGGVSFAWNNGLGANANATINAPGTYIVTTTAANGCIDTETITVTQDIATPTAGITNNTGTTVLTCTLTSINVTATGGVSYTWNNGLGTSANATITSAGTYTVTATGANGCTDTETITITADPTIPTAGITNNTGSTTLTCALSSISVTAIGGVSYTWNNGLGSTSGATITAPGTYTVTATAANGCTDTEVITVTQNITPPTAGITNNTGSTVLTCTQTSISVTATGGGTYSWNNGLGTSAGATITAAGTYTVTVTGLNGCTDTETITVTSNTGIPAPTASATVQPTCTTPTGTIVVTAPTGANIQYSVGGAYQISGTFTNLSPNTYNVTAQDMTNGCISSATVIVINPIPASPTVTLVSQTNITCSGLADGAIEVSVNGGLAPYVVSWNPNVGSGTNISNLTSGNYSINVTDANGCSTSETYIVTSPSPLVVTGVVNDIDCGVSLGSITTSVNGGTGPFTYAWSPNSEVTPDLNNLYVGIYVVTVTDVNGCQDSETFDIALSGNLTLDITPPSASINEGDTVDLSVTGATSYIWTPSTGLSCNDCPNPIATPDVTTTYTVSGTDAAGCTGTASILIYVEQYCEDFFVPNIFSPNGKGPDVNNTLCVYGSCIVELQYEVFNRWGEKVFETTDTLICWDGNWRGEPVGSGVFAYKLRAVLSNGEIIEKAGNLTVVY